MPTVHYSKLSPASWASTTYQPGYGPEALATEGLSRSWRATGALAETLVITLPTATAIQTLFLHDVNFALATVEKSVDGVAWTAAGELTTYANESGRRRGSLVVGAAGLLALRVSIAAGVPTDGLAYWRAGAAYLFGASAALPVGPRIGYGVRTQRAVIGDALPNNQVPLARTGSDADVIELAFERKFDQSLQTLVERAKAGTIVFSMDLADWPEQQWPARYVERESAEIFFRVRKAQRTVQLREMV